MHLSIHNRSWLRGMVAGAVALAGASACSHSDRSTAGRDTAQTGAVAAADTQTSASTQPTATAQPASVDTATAVPSASNSKASSDSVKAPHRTWRARPSGARAATASSDQGVSGYKAMGGDSSNVSGKVSDSTQVSVAAPQSTDTSLNAAVSDTTNAGAAPMARDTSIALAQSDTAVQTRVDSPTQVQADTATIGDTAVILTQSDTTKTEMAMGNESDTTAAATAAFANDSAATERIHADTVSQKAAELAKHEPARVRPPADSTADAAAVGAAGVASTGNIATGADAVAQMSNQGERCSVAASDEHRDVLWDMASSPATLNPCGTGTMTLPKIWTGEKK